MSCASIISITGGASAASVKHLLNWDVIKLSERIKVARHDVKVRAAAAAAAAAAAVPACYLAGGNFAARRHSVPKAPRF